MLQNTNQAKVRDSSIELLRIIAMIMIVFHHFAIHGGFEWSAAGSIPHFWYNFIIMGGKIGVNIFVLISGYFLINNDAKTINLEKIIKILGQVLFYSIVLFTIGKLTGIVDLGIKDFIKACFPITFSQWWFASAYFVLYLIHPFINKLLHSLDKSMYQTLLAVLVVCWSVIPTFTTSSYQSNSLLWFITLYSISGYIRLYGLNANFTAKRYFGFFLIFSLLTYASSIVLTVLGSKWETLASYSTYFFGQEKLTILLISLCLFMVFASLHINYHRWINIAASASFGVYLLHDNMVARPFLWEKLFKNAQYQETLLLIPYSVFVVAVVYVSCTFIDLLRQYTIEKPFMRIVRRCLNKSAMPLQKLCNMFKVFIFGK